MEPKDSQGDKPANDVADSDAARKEAVELTIGFLRSMRTGEQESLDLVLARKKGRDCDDMKGDAGDQSISHQDLADLCGREETIVSLISRIDSNIHDLEESGEVVCRYCHQPVLLERVALGFRICCPCSQKINSLPRKFYRR